MSYNKSVTDIIPLISPEKVLNEIVNDHVDKVDNWRKEVENILNGTDNRLLIITGPCSIHDIKSAKEYGKNIKLLRDKLESKLFIIMRVYFEKPRTTIGWKGHINDPFMNETYKIDDGLKSARSLLLYLTKIGVPCACEFLDTIVPQYIADLVTWGAIGARTVESQVHRELASGLSMPIGFKNSTSGNVDVAISAVKSASTPHSFLGIGKLGRGSIVHTSGNVNGHVILRGGVVPNYFKENINELKHKLHTNNLKPNVIVDCSHGNSQKQFKKQIDIAKYLVELLKTDKKQFTGLMIESNIKEGSQIFESIDKLEYGVSVTDSCLGWKDTEELLHYIYNSIIIDD